MCRSKSFAIIPMAEKLGSGSMSIYDGTALARKGVVLVTKSGRLS